MIGPENTKINEDINAVYRMDLDAMSIEQLKKLSTLITEARRRKGKERIGTLRPGDRVLVKRIEGDEKSSGGIIIPDSAQEKPSEGEVLAVGPGARGDDGKIHPLDVKTGNKILFGKWSGSEIKIDGEDLIIMKESDIMGIIQ